MRGQRLNKRFISVIFVLTGFTSIVVQTMLLKEFVMVFAGNEFSLGIFFASWLISVAIGSLIFSRLPQRLQGGFLLFLVLQIISLLFLPLQILIIKGARLILGINPGEIIPSFPVFYYPLLFLIPFGFIHGFQFALACKIYSDFESDSARAIGKIYFYDAIGDMLGGFAFGYFFINFFHPFQIWAFLLALTLLFFLVFSIKNSFYKTTACMAILSCFLVINVFNGNLSRLNTALLRLCWKGFNLVEVRSSRYGDFAVVKKGNLSSVYENGILSFTNPDYLHSEEIVHLPLLQVPNPENILILGGGISGPIREILKYSPRKVDYVELDRVFVDLSLGHITPEDSYALSSPVVKIHNLDGRTFIKTYKEKSFDCVIVNTGKPTTAIANRFYTLDFFREVSGILNEKGVISLGIDSNENYLGLELKNFNGCIYSTVKKVFPYIILIPGETLFIIASRSPSFLTYEPTLLIKRLKARKIKTQFLNEYTLPYYFLPERINYIRSAIEEVERKRLNRDFYPISYYFNLILGEAKFRSNTALIFWNISKIKFWWIVSGLIILIVIFTLSKRKVSSIISLAVANTGFAGISLEIILILGFQALYGYLYHLVGIIIASFMLGLVLGVIYITPRLTKIEDEAGMIAKWQTGLGIYSLFLAGLLYFLSFYSGGTMVHVNIQILFPLLTLFDGFFIGLVFPLASKYYAKLTNKSAGEIGGMLYASDLLGACVGSVLISVFLVPLYGVFNALILIAFLSFTISVILRITGKKLEKLQKI